MGKGKMYMYVKNTTLSKVGQNEFDSKANATIEQAILMFKRAYDTFVNFEGEVSQSTINNKPDSSSPDNTQNLGKITNSNNKIDIKTNAKTCSD